MNTQDDSSRLYYNKIIVALFSCIPDNMCPPVAHLSIIPAASAVINSPSEKPVDRGGQIS